MNTPAPKTSPDAALGNLLGAALGTPDTARPIGTPPDQPPSYGAPAEVAQRIEQYIGRYGREDTATLLLYEAMNALRRHSPTAGDALTAAARDVLAERQRQISAEGWTPEQDDRYTHGDMASAAACYANQGRYHFPEPGKPGPNWPWAAEWWKPSTYRRNLEKAGALILAEIERLDRAAAITAHKRDE